MTTGFLFNNKCVAPPLCTCSSNNIHCDSKNLSQVPVFSKHNEQYYSLNVYLSFNRLAIIPAYAFQNLSAVNASTIYLYLQYNHISNIEMHAFSGVENVIKYLNLENNNLTHLPLALTEFSSLYSLNILGNPLGRLDTHVLANISSPLKSLYISFDRFPSFPTVFQLLTSLSVLTINGITFPMLHATVFHTLEYSLTALELSNANFESMPAAVCRLKSLTSFSMNNSPSLSKYNSSIFDECNHRMTNVTTLSLQWDKLSMIPKLADIFPHLRSLLLYGNNLYFIESSSLAGLTSLTELSLGFNHLTRIPFAVSKVFNLRNLGIVFNQIKTVEDLDLSRLRNLTSVNLHGNPIVYLSPLAFAHNPLLEDINMRSTFFGHVPRAFLGLKHLRNVDLSGKPIECSCHDMHYLKTWNVTSISIDAMCSSGKSVKIYLISDLPRCP